MKKTKDKKAVALRYDTTKEPVPRVIAKGSGRIAENIIELAMEHGIPVKSDPDLIEVLSTLKINEEIPPSLYIAVAELLAFVYSLNSKKK
ncbi:MAG: EscU/YscU/HrcU family type III secretion system export apparatus switch protein [Desulfamplus sp.]|nr:EscU/YscU/HrcU family type III secretion system export apparatus switch protein [Desulfamplus sp.]